MIMYKVNNIEQVVEKPKDEAQSQMIELFINNEYKGIYNLAHNIPNNEFNIGYKYMPNYNKEGT